MAQALQGRADAGPVLPLGEASGNQIIVTETDA